MRLPKPSPSSAALVTGASAGIGTAIARELAACGGDALGVEPPRQRHGPLVVV